MRSLLKQSLQLGPAYPADALHQYNARATPLTNLGRRRLSGYLTSVIDGEGNSARTTKRPNVLHA